jgi:Pentapeptide repeats (8 copies)/WD domain, G-beta repeat
VLSVAVASSLIVALLFIGKTRWYRYTQISIVMTLAGGRVGGWAGVGIALGLVAVLLFIVEGLVGSRRGSGVRLNHGGEQYAERLRRIRDEKSVVPDTRITKSYLYFDLKCVDGQGRVSSSALEVLSQWAAVGETRIAAMFGGFGTGKSTTCLELCLALMQANCDRVPIYLPINTVSVADCTSDWLMDILGREYGLLSKFEDPTGALVHDDRVVLVLDGLESAEQYFGYGAVGTIAQRIEREGASRLVLSARRLAESLPSSEQTRTQGFGPILSLAIGLLPLAPQEQSEYSETVHGTPLPPAVVAGVTGAGVQTLDRPFLIDLAYSASVSGASVGASLAAVYAAATDAMLSADEREKGSQRERARRVLMAFAVEAYALGEEQLPQDVAIAYLQRSTRLLPEELARTLEACRLLTDYGGRIGFAHRSLAEFFVASALLDHVRQGELEILQTFLLVDPVLQFALTLLNGASDREVLTTKLHAAFSEQALDRDSAVPGFGTANLASLLAGLGVALRNVTIANLSLAGASLGGLDLKGAALTNVDMSGVDLSSAILEGAHLNRVVLANAFVQDVNLSNAVLVDCDLWNLRWIDEPSSLWAARWLWPGQRIICATSAGLLDVCKGPADVRSYKSFGLGRSGMLDVDFDPKTSTLIASDRAGRVVKALLEPSTGDLTVCAVDESSHAANVRRIRFAPAGPCWYATASRDGSVRLFVQDVPVPYRQHGRHKAPVMDLAWRSDGAVVASGGYDGKVFIWDISSPFAVPVSVTQGEAGSGKAVRAVAFSPSGRCLAASGDNGLVMQWVLDSRGAPVDQSVLGSMECAVFALQYLSETQILAGTWDGDVLLLEDGVTTLCWHHEDVVRAIHVDGRVILTASWDGGVAVTDSISGPCARPKPAVLDQNPRGSGSSFVGMQLINPVGLGERYLRQFQRLGVQIG